jgi:hypothetical protein
MDPIQVDKATRVGDEKPSRPWLQALFSGAVFGTMGAAAMSWLGHHSVPKIDRAKPSMGRSWMTALGGLASGTVAVYGTLHQEKPPSVAHDASHRAIPEKTVATHSVQMDSTVRSPGERSL